MRYDFFHIKIFVMPDKVNIVFHRQKVVPFDREKSKVANTVIGC